ncbi:ATP-binding protein [Paenibacillus flagellatus]|uniref:histidine kinase n=1 Tax=Paenibacillus flagellatus TaxID=2211139 RepID=A0A2V5KPC5_9BACL|nr:ATP-binding protein [Paenibacillus flagellatus]PYI53007.1 hypothetical protein DLM86_18580 [Paenibacillus flagellatus]
MNVFDFVMESPDIDFYIASVDERMEVVSANAKFKETYRVDVGDALPDKSQLRKVVSLAINQKQNVSGVVIEEPSGERVLHLILFCYRLEAEEGDRYHTALFDISGLSQYYEMKLMNEKRKLIGDMAAGTANSILNPLAVVRGSLQLIEATLKANLASNHLSDHLVSQSVDHYITLATHQVTEISKYVKRWLHLGKPFQLQLRPVLLSAFLESYVPSVQKEAIRQGVSLVCEYPAVDGHLLVDPYYLQEVLNEFMKNSFEATNGSGRIRLAVELTGEGAAFTIRDSGPGIAEDVMKQVKDPFFTTKEDSIGLGLSFCEVVLHKMGGRYELKGDEAGTEVRISLPRVPAE